MLSRIFNKVKISNILLIQQGHSLRNNIFPISIIRTFHDAPGLNSEHANSQGQLTLLHQRDFFQDFEHKYKLSKVKDLQKIFCLIDHDEIHYSLNEMGYFLKRIAELLNEKHIKNSKYVSSEIAHLVQRIKHDLRESSQEEAMIGTFAWSFWKLGYNDDQELWLTLGDYILDDRFHPTYEESVQGIEGFCILKNVAPENYIEEVYNKLERICFFGLKKANINEYRRITSALINANRSTQAIFNKIEGLILGDLEENYETDVLLEIVNSFAFSMNGSKEFYSTMEKFLIKDLSHPENLNINALNSYVAKLVTAYSLAKNTHPDLQYTNEFKQFISNCLLNEKLCYGLADIVNIKKNLDSLNLANLDNLHHTLDKKLFEISGEMDTYDMVNYIDLIAMRDYEEKYELVPDKIPAFFDSYLNRYLSIQSPQRMYHYLLESNKRNLINKKKELVNNMVPYILSRLRDHNSEQLSYYYTLFDDFGHLIDQKQINQALSELKDFIQFLCYRRGFE